MKAEFIFLLFAVVVLAIDDNMYTLQLLSTQRGARCLDGSPLGLYYHEGTGDNAQKYMIYMNGGGFCAGFTLQQSIQACYQRSKKDLGTTKVAPAYRSFDGNGLLSTKPEQNPLFHDWTKLYFIYCDGTEYTGSLEDPIAYKDTRLYFRGYNNALEQFRFMDEHFDFYNGEAIVLTGVSAGGMGTFFYSNHLVENTKKAKIYSIPDSGVFLVDFYSELAHAQILKDSARAIMLLVNSEQDAFPIKQCFDDNRQDILECYTTSNLTKYLKAPTLLIQSTYDSFSLKNIVYANCSTKGPPYSIASCDEHTRQIIEEYRQFSVQAIKKLRGTRKDVGVWGPACAQHGFTDQKSFNDPRYRVPSGSGPMAYEAIQQFLDNPDNAPWHLDQVSWPYNSGCSGLSLLTSE